MLSVESIWLLINRENELLLSLYYKKKKKKKEYADMTFPTRKKLFSLPP
jgi:hypothetical protein